MKLKDVLQVQSESGKSEEMSWLICEELNRLGCDWWFDPVGNIYAVKGDASLDVPCFVSHIDTVHKIIKHYSVGLSNGVYFALDTRDYSRVGVGGDDKVGVFICLSALEKYENFRCVFFADEEIGCVGSGECQMDFFDRATVVLQADRTGNSDFISFTNGIEVCGKEFLSLVEPILERYGYSSTIGTMTDVGELKCNGLKVACANISCGYYGAHTDNEYVVVREVYGCRDLMFQIAEMCGSNKQLHEATKSKYDFDSLDDSWNWTTKSWRTWKSTSSDDKGYCECCGETGELKFVTGYNMDVCQKCISEYQLY